jgi:uncharacterized membrane protein
MLDLLTFNLDWMSYNLFLALIPVILAWSAYSVKNKLLKISILIVWLMFTPNTVYIVTDILHFLQQANDISIFSGIILFIQYFIFLILGLLTYILSLYPIEKILKKHYKKQKENIIILLIAINFLIGFGVVLGRVHRLNSWDVILELQKVLDAAKEVIFSPSLILLAILFGLFANLVYFLFKEKIIKIISRHL